MQRILQDHYKDHCKWFAPVELVRRLLLPIFIVIDPGNLVSKPQFFVLVTTCTMIITYTCINFKTMCVYLYTVACNI